MTSLDYDLVVVGGGAAGLGAASTAARAGARTLLVSDGPPGGDCTFTGCVPSKTLIESAKQGLAWDAAAQRVRDAVARIAATEDPAALRRTGIDVRLGRARFTNPGRLDVDGRQMTAARFVVATGARPAIPPIPGLAGVPYLTNETVFDLPTLPASLAVLGGGATGCELAQAFARLGSAVTLVEGLDRLLPHEEPEAAAVVTDVFAREGIDVRTSAQIDNAQVDSVSAEPGGVQLRLAGGVAGGVVSAQRLLVATGRQPDTAGLNLDAVGVRLDGRGQVVTDQHLATSAPGVYAAGDVTGRLAFTHAAFEMGRVAAGNALARRPWQRHRYRPDATPWVTFTDPEVARVGLLEAQAAPRGGRVAHLPWPRWTGPSPPRPPTGSSSSSPGRGRSCAISAAGGSSARPSSPPAPAS
jgi:pyruvate/2-oxoglutarate dehydrogenase complex dihydrolipoamide dehydrogenase (E3) component